MKSLYLCGPITGLTYDGCTNWRKYVASKLADDVIPISPMRGKEYLNTGDKIKVNNEGTLLSDARSIKARDRNDVKECGAVLANFLGSTSVSIGSVLEFGWADAWMKPIIMVAESNNPHRVHPLTNQAAGFIVEDLDSGIKIANILLSAIFAKSYQ